MGLPPKEAGEGTLPTAASLLQPQWDNDNIYLIMEFCAGGDLSRFIHTRRILPEKVARVFMQQLGKSQRHALCSLPPYPNASQSPVSVSLPYVGSSSTCEP